MPLASACERVCLTYLFNSAFFCFVRTWFIALFAHLTTVGSIRLLRANAMFYGSTGGSLASHCRHVPLCPYQHATNSLHGSPSGHYHADMPNYAIRACNFKTLLYQRASAVLFPPPVKSLRTYHSALAACGAFAPHPANFAGGRFLLPPHRSDSGIQNGRRAYNGTTTYAGPLRSHASAACGHLSSLSAGATTHFSTTGGPCRCRRGVLFFFQDINGISGLL